VTEEGEPCIKYWHWVVHLENYQKSHKSDILHTYLLSYIGFCFLVVFLITSPVGAVVKYCDEYVCVCVSVCEDISGNTHAIFTKFFVHVAYVHGSVILQHVDNRPHHLSAGRSDGSA